MCKSGWHTDKRFLTIRLVCQWNYFPFGVVSSLPLEWFKLRLPRLLQVKSQNSPPRNVSYLKTGLYFLQFWNWCFPVPGPEPIFNKSSAGKCTDGWIHWERKCARWSPKAPITLRLSDFISSQCPLKGPNKASHPHCKDGKNSPCKVAASRALRPPAWAAAYLSWSPKNRQSPVSFLESEDEGCSHQRSRHWKTLCAPGRLSWGACWKQTSEPTSGVLTQQAWARPRGRPLNEPCGPICCFGPLSDPTVRNPVLGEQWHPQESGKQGPTSMVAPQLRRPPSNNQPEGLPVMPKLHSEKGKVMKWWNGFYGEWAVASCQWGNVSHLIRGTAQVWVCLALPPKLNHPLFYLLNNSRLWLHGLWT